MTVEGAAAPQGRAAPAEDRRASRRHPGDRRGALARRPLRERRLRCREGAAGLHRGPHRRARGEARQRAGDRSRGSSTPTAASCSARRSSSRTRDSGERVTYQIVGDDEADIKHGKISVSSPIARALIGSARATPPTWRRRAGRAATRSWRSVTADKHRDGRRAPALSRRRSRKRARGARQRRRGPRAGRGRRRATPTTARKSSRSRIKARRIRRACSSRRTEPRGKVAFLFPGQGSQRVGMLRDLFDAYPELDPVLALGARWQGHHVSACGRDARGRSRAKGGAHRHARRAARVGRGGPCDGEAPAAAWRRAEHAGRAQLRRARRALHRRCAARGVASRACRSSAAGASSSRPPTRRIPARWPRSRPTPRRPPRISRVSKAS